MTIIGGINVMLGLYNGNPFNFSLGVFVYSLNIFWLYKEYMKFPEVVKK